MARGMAGKAECGAADGGGGGDSLIASMCAAGGASLCMVDVALHSCAGSALMMRRSNLSPLVALRLPHGLERSACDWLSDCCLKRREQRDNNMQRQR